MTPPTEAGAELRQHIGRLLVVGIPGPRLDDDTRRMLAALHVGGVILFRRNLERPAQIAALTAELHALPSRPLIAIDHEGGRVLRVGEPFTPFPPAAVVGRSNDAELAFRAGRAMAEELAGVGIDVNFAPVLDVHSNPENPIIGDRAFGSDPGLVSAMGVATIEGLRAGGVIPCGKHFPGHGDTDEDSHHRLPVVRRTRADIERVELPPFRAAIAAGVPLLMTAHVLYPALDGERPATLSRPILRDLLRDELGFRGIVVSDDLEMRAIADHHDMGAAAVATLQAGASLLLVCEDLSKAADAVSAVASAVRAGVLGAQVIEAAADAMRALQCSQARAGGRTCQLPDAAHRSLVDEIYRRARS